MFIFTSNGSLKYEYAKHFKFVTLWVTGCIHHKCLYSRQKGSDNLKTKNKSYLQKKKKKRKIKKYIYRYFSSLLPCLCWWEGKITSWVFVWINYVGCTINMTEFGNFVWMFDLENVSMLIFLYLLLCTLS